MTDQPSKVDPVDPEVTAAGDPATEPATAEGRTAGDPVAEPATAQPATAEGHTAGDPAAEPATAQPTGLVVVTRSGGFAGMTLRGQVNLDRLDDPDRMIWQSALSEGLTQVTPHEPTPDRFVYRVRSAQAGLDITVGDHELPDHLRSLLDSAVHPPT
jgi:hypothetical protein